MFDNPLISAQQAQTSEKKKKKRISVPAGTEVGTFDNTIPWQLPRAH